MPSDLLILDTHIWVWLLNGDDDQLSEEGLEAIAEASESGQIGVCAISIWEVGMLEEKGRLHLSQGCLDWVRAALSAPSIRLLALTPGLRLRVRDCQGRFMAILQTKF